MNSFRKLCLSAAISALACFNLTACRSAYVQTAIVNHTGTTASLIEVDYPSASFGTQQIAEGAVFHYHFKVQDEGPVKITWTTPANKTYTVTGPTLTQGQQGSLTITLEDNGKAAWIPQLTTIR